MTLSLVTGASGFLGSRLARALRARGDRVRALDLARSAWHRLDGLEVEAVRGSITDRGAVAAAFEGVDRVFHAAALYEIGTRDAARMAQINVGGAAVVLEAAASRGVPAVHVSSCAALGPTGEAPATEAHWSATPARSAYEATKREAHLYARRMIEAGARIRIALPATIYGAGDPSLIGWAHRLLAAGRLPFAVKPRLRLCFVHVDDCAEAVARIAERGRDGEEYILCSDVLALAEWFEAFGRATGRAPPRVAIPEWLLRASTEAARRIPPPALARSRALRLLREATGMADGAHWAFSGDKARRELGWSPRGFAEGMAEVAAWCRAGAPARPLGADACSQGANRASPQVRSEA